MATGYLPKVRKLVHQTNPEAREEIKRHVQLYFTLNGNIIALLGKLNEKAQLDLFKEVIKNNRVGGWRKLRR